jgi:DNA/RNA endonuclease G (NUC1)
MGFYRGHLWPAADLVFDKEAMITSFFMSNMSEQSLGSNRGA